MVERRLTRKQRQRLDDLVTLFEFAVLVPFELTYRGALSLSSNRFYLQRHVKACEFKNYMEFETLDQLERARAVIEAQIR